MPFPARRLSAALMLATLSAAPGCGGKTSVDTTTAEARVTGTVMAFGKPLSSGELTFDSSNYQRKDAGARVAQIKPDGSYEITTLAGQNTVTLGGPPIMKDQRLSGAFQAVDLKAGDQKVDFEFPPK